MSTNPQWKNRRLAARALRVLERTQALDTTLAAFNLTLAPAATSFIESYDRLRVLSRRRSTERREGKEAVDALARSVRSWASQIQALDVIEGFTSGDYIDNPDVPDDVISDAASFLALVAEHTEENPDSIPYLDSLVPDVTEKLAVARKEWTEAEVVRAEHQDLVELNRTSEISLNAHLVAFRRSLAAILGNSHPEYRTLRAHRVSRLDPEDGTVRDTSAGAQGQPTPPPATPALESDEADGEASEEHFAEAG